jgi:purine-binding chemotaxis protein CheW
VAPEVENAAVRFLTFKVGEQLYALRSEDVSEVMRVPAMAKVPQGPAALLGIANLRGAVLPVAGLRELLGRARASDTTDSRVIVLDVGAPVALVVDSVEGLESRAAGDVETRQKEVSAEGGEKLLGVIAVGNDKRVAKILDIKALIEGAFSSRSRAARPQRSLGTAARMERADAGLSAGNSETLVTFDVAGQEFALPLDVVQEIIPAPAAITAIARAEEVVLGITAVRDTLLPLLSLRGLLGFRAAEIADDREKVVVMRVGGSLVGLVADRARAIIAADLQLIDAVPPVLAARVGGESRIRAVYRGDSGRRLISILAPEQLFRDDVMQRLKAGQAAPAIQTTEAVDVNQQELIFLVFRLGGDEFGLPIDTVVEVAQVPEQITRVPKTPKFLEGVVNLRGEVLPVVDQRRRFDLPKLDQTEGRRLVVIRTERHRAGLIVDGVSDVLRTTAGSIEPPPELTEATSRLVRGVINLEKTRRIVLLLDPTELLTRAEQGLLDTFQAKSAKADA